MGASFMKYLIFGYLFLFALAATHILQLGQ